MDVKEHASQDDGASRVESDQEGNEVTETIGPRTELEKHTNMGAGDISDIDPVVSQAKLYMRGSESAMQTKG